MEDARVHPDRSQCQSDAQYQRPTDPRRLRGLDTRRDESGGAQHVRIALSARGRGSLEPGVRYRRLDGGTRTTTAASPCFAPPAPAPSSPSTPRSLPPAPSSTLTAPPQPPDPNRATRREPNINDEIAANLAGVRLATGHMPVPAPDARQEPVQAGVASTCTTCSVVSVRGARYGTGSFTEGAPAVPVSSRSTLPRATRSPSGAAAEPRRRSTTRRSV